MVKLLHANKYSFTSKIENCSLETILTFLFNAIEYLMHLIDRMIFKRNETQILLFGQK